MTELRERVLARLVAAQNAKDAAPLREDAAVGDALALLREAAPSPAEAVDLESVAAVFWTFWLRHEGADDPDAARNVSVVVSTFGFLYPRVPDNGRFPQPLRDGFDPADPANGTRFEHLVSSAYGEAALGAGPETAGPGRLAALDSALAWSQTARHYLPDGHDGFVELALHSVGLYATRFQLAADPDSLAVAARTAAAVCERLPHVEPGVIGPAGAAAPAMALGMVLDAARLLGAPSMAEIERLAALVPDAADTPEVAESLRFLRQMYAEPGDWPGELDLRAGEAIVDAGTRERDASRIACGVRRLRAALVRTPDGHPARAAVTAALGRGLEAFAAEREKPVPVEEAAPGPAVGPGLFDPDRRFPGAVPPSDIDLEILRLATAIGAAADGGSESVSVSVSDEQIDRYRAALAALPADRPHRYAYVAVLAALVGLWAQQTAQPDSEARVLTAQAAAGAPADFLPLDLLRNGHFEVALPVAVMSVPIGAPDGVDVTPDAELVKAVSQLSRIGSLRLDDPANLAADIEVIRGLLAETSEDDPSLRAPLAAGLGSALSAQASGQGDPSNLDEIVQLLRYARTHQDESGLGGEIERLLASALTTWSAVRLDPEAAREAAALLASSVADGPPADAVAAVLALHTELHNALQNFLLGHEPRQLERARELARRIKEAGDGLPAFDMMGDAYVDLIETIGPDGGPKPDITDEQVDQCRGTYRACPAGHPMRLFTGTTLMRALTQRAVAVQRTDQRRAVELVAEAGHLVDALDGAAPDGWGDTMRFFVGVVATQVTGGSLPPHFTMAQAMPQLRDMPLAMPHESALPASFRAHGQLGAAAGAVKRGDTEAALTHVEAAVDAMADITDRGSDQESAEYGLRAFEGDVRAVVELVLVQTLGEAGAGRMGQLSAEVDEFIRVIKEERRVPDAMPDIAGMFRTVEGPGADRAAEVLERGRGLLLSRRIEARADLGELSSVHPELSREFERLTDELNDQPSDRPDERPDGRPAGGRPPGAAGHAEWSRLARLRASRELDALVAEIRTRPGFDGFLRPLSAERLRALAADGPVVVLNHARMPCQALVVTERSITGLLLDVQSDEVADVARRMRDAVGAINAQGTARPSPLQLVAAGATIRETLSWTWHKIVRPVLAHTGLTGQVPDGAVWPRIWWVPTGAFHTLPLHAAQCTLPDCELDGCGAALDVVMSSYVPGFQTLAYARGLAGHRDEADNASALLVASPEDELPGVAAAAGYAAGLLGARAPLVGAAATRDAVLAALGGTAWAHFGCHAATDPAEPSGALLHLPNGESLSVLEICRIRPRSARLAFLAACGTARTSERLSDEAIHITSAFLLAGFPAVVGTLWEIDSTHADRVTRDFYRRMTYDSSVTAADALHHTVRELRRRIPDRPHVWAAYVHAGT